jgi:outer membrane lipoprotein-sorting protein
MRWILPLVVLAMGLPSSAQENEGEKLFRKLEQKVRSAKGLKVTFDVDGQFGKETAKTKGYLLVTEGNKGRLEIQTTVGDKTVVEQMIADGKDSAFLEAGKIKGEKKPVDPASTEAALSVSIRAGVLAVLQVGPDPKNKFDVDKVLPASDFKLGAKEKLGEREAQVLTYKLSPPMGDPMQITLWIDTKTELPLKRTTLGKAKDVKLSAVEVYGEFVLNPTFDAKIFELPK